MTDRDLIEHRLKELEEKDRDQKADIQRLESHLNRIEIQITALESSKNTAVWGVGAIATLIGLLVAWLK